MNSFRFAIGVILLVAVVPLFLYVEDVKDVKMGFFGAVTIEKIVQMCNGGWGDVFNIAGQCIKVQAFYYSPWIAGFIGAIFLAKAGPYRGYGHGGPRMRPRTKKRIIIAFVVIVIIIVGIFLYTNFDITVGNQKIDDIIPTKDIEKTFDEIYDQSPIKLNPKP